MLAFWAILAFASAPPARAAPIERWAPAIDAALRQIPAVEAGFAAKNLSALNFRMENGALNPYTARMLAPVVALIEMQGLTAEQFEEKPRALALSAAINAHSAAVDREALRLIMDYAGEQASPAQLGADAESAEDLLLLSRPFLREDRSRTLTAILPEMREMAKAGPSIQEKVTRVERQILRALERNPYWGQTPETTTPAPAGRRFNAPAGWGLKAYRRAETPPPEEEPESSPAQGKFQELQKICLGALDDNRHLKGDIHFAMYKLKDANDMLGWILLHVDRVANAKHAGPAALDAYYARWRALVAKVHSAFEKEHRPTAQEIAEISRELKRELGLYKKDLNDPAVALTASAKKNQKDSVGKVLEYARQAEALAEKLP